VTGLEGLPRKVVKQDLAIENGRVVAYRTKVKDSFKYEGKG
jgi:flavin-binding protein dodecin